MSKFLIIILFKQKKNVKHTHTNTHTTRTQNTHARTSDAQRNGKNQDFRQKQKLTLKPSVQQKRQT